MTEKEELRNNDHALNGHLRILLLISYTSKFERNQNACSLCVCIQIEDLDRHNDT